ncbi:MAG: UvrABC system protein C [Legionellaceae bacterium]
MSNIIQKMDTFDPISFLKTVTVEPGVYQMMNAAGDVIYVGKARNLKKRLSSYFQKKQHSPKTVSLVKQIHRIEIIVTNSENEALLLENNLIKRFRPRYNILFRDDKSYPYIFLSKHSTYPRLGFYRGMKKEQGRYFGPYPNSYAVRDSLQLMQKLFQIRQCEDTFFQHRSRPCLQYHIKRCTGPCVGLISPEDYQRDIENAILFLEGKNHTIIQNWVNRMEEASNQLNFELAVKYRDQITQLRHIQEQQYVESKGMDTDVDIIAGIIQSGEACVQILFIRQGRLLGNRVYYPKIPEEVPLSEFYNHFLPQFYLSSTRITAIPKEIILNKLPTECELLESVLTEQSGHKVKINSNVRSMRAKWIQIAENNAKQALTQYLTGKASMRKRFEKLKEDLGLPFLPQRLECFDVSHTLGEATVASCVVFNRDGPVKQDYRHFNITDIPKGDDYAAMHQALLRRYKKLKLIEAKIPDIIFIDGGKGQLAQAEQVMEELQLTGVTLIAIAKGLGRKPGLETLFISGKGSIILASDSTALHLIQYIRDEAHAFAVSGHRQRRSKVRKTSSLENIPGIGVARRRELLRQLGGLQEVKKASVEELAKVPTISKSMAQKIHDYLRNH